MNIDVMINGMTSKINVYFDMKFTILLDIYGKKYDML
jgi:hypothetical protein